MNVSLTPQLVKYIAERVERGGYATASEVVREALRRLQEFERGRADGAVDRRRLKAAVRAGFRQIDKGEGVSLTARASGGIKAEANRRHFGARPKAS